MLAIESGFVSVSARRLVPGFSVAPSPVSGGNLKSDAIFATAKEEIAKQADLAKSVGGVFLYNITANGKTVKQWTLDLKTPEVHEGAPKSGKADVNVTVSDSDLLEIASGTLSPQVAYLKGKLKLSGNIMMAQKLEPFLKAPSKL